MTDPYLPTRTFETERPAYGGNGFLMSPIHSRIKNSTVGKTRWHESYYFTTSLVPESLAENKQIYQKSPEYSKLRSAIPEKIYERPYAPMKTKIRILMAFVLLSAASLMILFGASNSQPSGNPQTEPEVSVPTIVSTSSGNGGMRTSLTRFYPVRDTERT